MLKTGRVSPVRRRIRVRVRTRASLCREKEESPRAQDLVHAHADLQLPGLAAAHRSRRVSRPSFVSQRSIETRSSRSIIGCWISFGSHSSHIRRSRRRFARSRVRRRPSTTPTTSCGRPSVASAAPLLTGPLERLESTKEGRAIASDDLREAKQPSKLLGAARKADCQARRSKERGGGCLEDRRPGGRSHRCHSGCRDCHSSGRGTLGRLRPRAEGGTRPAPPRARGLRRSRSSDRDVRSGGERDQTGQEVDQRSPAL